MDNGMHVDPETQEMLRSFVSEALDSLDTYEPVVDDLKNDNNEESVNAIFRVFHTLKGLSGFFEMHIINKVTHEAETLLDVMRKQNRPQEEETLTTIYQTFDFLRELLEQVNEEFTDVSGEEESGKKIEIIRNTLEAVKQENSGTAVQATEQVEVAAEAEIQAEPDMQEPDTEEQMTDPVDAPADGEMKVEAETDYDDQDDDQGMKVDDLISDDLRGQYITNAMELIDLVEKNLIDLESDPENMKLVQETFGAMHSLKGNSGFMGFGEIEEIAGDMESILDAVRDKNLDIDQGIISVLLSSLETIRDRIERISGGESSPAQESKIASTVKNDEQPQIHLDEHEEMNNEPAGKNKVEEKPKAQPPEKNAKTEPKKQVVERKTTPSMNVMHRKDIRVETEKIDKLFDMVGELITIETMVTNNPDLRGLNLPNFTKSANMLNKITRDLQEISMSIRMMPLEGLFNKMKRLVRDVSIKMGKKINLQVYGQHTEMDKNVIDEISDPLVHILRNAIDHGVESPEDRAAIGKPEAGKISLGAKYEGNEILIIVEDDGAGLDKERILSKAVEKGLIKTEPENLTDKEIFMLIFEPGFSTAKQVTDISGRGVGMDVVRKNIEKLRGNINIDSTSGKGSKFTLRIPLTLAIMEAMLIRVGDEIFALPILSIKESFKPDMEKISRTMDGLEVIKVREEVLPIVRLHELMGIQSFSETLNDGILITIETRNDKICLFADEIVGQQQAVIKNLSDYIGKVDGLTGCMILGDGGIGLILDVDSLYDMSVV